MYILRALSTNGSLGSQYAILFIAETSDEHLTFTTHHFALVCFGHSFTTLILKQLAGQPIATSNFYRYY